MIRNPQHHAHDDQLCDRQRSRGGQIQDLRRLEPDLRLDGLVAAPPQSHHDAETGRTEQERQGSTRDDRRPKAGERHAPHGAQGARAQCLGGFDLPRIQPAPERADGANHDAVVEEHHRCDDAHDGRKPTERDAHDDRRKDERNRDDTAEQRLTGETEPVEHVGANNAKCDAEGRRNSRGEEREPQRADGARRGRHLLEAIEGPRLTVVEASCDERQRRPEEEDGKERGRDQPGREPCKFAASSH